MNGRGINSDSLRVFGMESVRQLEWNERVLAARINALSFRNAPLLTTEIITDNVDIIS